MVGVYLKKLFIGRNDADKGLYEGMVKGRRLFGSTQEPHGFGIINYYPDDRYLRQNYTGQWQNGTRHGNGTTYFKDGSSYRGEYRNGLEDGQGTVRFPNGDLLQGEFSGGQISGHVVIKYLGGDQREGFYINGEFDGQAVFTQSNGKTLVELWKKGERIQPPFEPEKTGPQTVLGTFPPPGPSALPTSQTNLVSKIAPAEEATSRADSGTKGPELLITGSLTDTGLVFKEPRNFARSGDKSLSFSQLEGLVEGGVRRAADSLGESFRSVLSATANLIVPSPKEETLRHDNKFLRSLFDFLNERG